MSEPRVVTPQEAQSDVDWGTRVADVRRYAFTVATEPKRTRAAVIEALLPIRRNIEAHVVTAKALGHDQRPWLDLLILIERAERADAVENGAPL